jgi:8-oxo-dGTP pyrophosphatase MutT (NUDIX family)
MSPKRITWFKLRAITFANIQKLFGFILQVPIPPKVSAACFIERDGKLLVLDLSYRTGYAFPGGMIEPKENIETGVVREVLEETGLKVESLHYIGSKEDVQYGLTVIAIAFSATTSGETCNSDEGTLLWLTPDEIQENQSYLNWKYLLNMYLKN